MVYNSLEVVYNQAHYESPSCKIVLRFLSSQWVHDYLKCLQKEFEEYLVYKQHLINFQNSSEAWRAHGALARRRARQPQNFLRLHFLWLLQTLLVLLGLWKMFDHVLKIQDLPYLGTSFGDL